MSAPASRMRLRLASSSSTGSPPMRGGLDPEIVAIVRAFAEAHAAADLRAAEAASPRPLPDAGER